MRKNLIPFQPQRVGNKSSSSISHQASIRNHLGNLQSMMIRPQPQPQSIKKDIEKEDEFSDDSDYYDDMILDDSEDSQSDQSQNYLEDVIKIMKKENSVTEAQILSLPKAKITNKMEGVCAICLEEWVSKQNQKKESQTDEYIILPCAHKFHFSCIRDWLRMKNKCPCCNNFVFQ